MLNLLLDILIIFCFSLLLIIGFIMIPHHFITVKKDMNFALTKWDNHEHYLVQLSFFEFLKIYHATPWVYHDFRKCIVKRNDYIIHFNLIDTVLYRFWNRYIRYYGDADNAYKLDLFDLIQEDIGYENDSKYVMRVQKIIDKEYGRV